MSNQVFVVEGRHDEMRLKSIFKNIYVVTTNGREISDDTLDMIKKLSLDNEIILFLDPDSPGEKIRNIITNIVPNATQAFLRKKDCISNNHKKVGIEHASDEVILEALNHIYRNNKIKEDISVNDLYDLALVGSVNSANLRAFICNQLNIGNPNAKTFLKRINMFGISLETLRKLVKEYE